MFMGHHPHHLTHTHTYTHTRAQGWWYTAQPGHPDPSLLQLC